MKSNIPLISIIFIAQFLMIPHDIGKDNTGNISPTVSCGVFDNAGEKISASNESSVSIDSKICSFHFHYEFDVNGNLSLCH